MVTEIEQLRKDVDYLIEKVKRHDKGIKQLQCCNDKCDSLLGISELEAIGEHKQSTFKPTPNQKRKRSIDKAKELLSTYLFYENGNLKTIYEYVKYDVKFIVNKDKRNIEVLLTSTIDNKTKKLRGYSKCLISDVWNEYIGKAIALGKVLQLDINDLLHIENPNEVTVGQVVKWNDTMTKLLVTKIREGIEYKYYNFIELECDLVHTNIPYLKIENYCNIIEDTDAKY